MKACVFLIVCLVMQTAGAEELCNGEFVKNSQAVRAISFLQSIAGHYKGDTCEISIQVCDGYSDTETSVQVGAVLLVDKKSGQDFYLPLDFQSTDTRKTRFEIENGRRMFHYEFSDRNPDPGLGSVVVFLFEAVKTDDLSSLQYVELGIRRPTESRIQWAVCKFAN